MQAKRPTTGHLPPPADARALAWWILQQVEAGGFADALLGSALSSPSLDSRDQALAARLVYGTLAWQGYLDHLLAAFSKKAIGKLDVPIRCLLRMALLQMCKLDRIPTFAAVDTAVNLSKQHRGGSASGFVNAVLRRAARDWSSVPLPNDGTAANLAVRLSHPLWLVERWLTTYGADDTEALLAANNEAAPTTLRVNRRRAERDTVLERLREAGVEAEACRFSPLGVILQSGARIETLPGFAEGWFSVQGEASQLVSLLAAPQPNTRVLDACAAPGGKTTHLAELMDDQGEVTALDIHGSGVTNIRAAATRLGLSIVKASRADAAAWPAPAEPFDTVLVDAPCSGLGTLRQHPEIRWRRSAADIDALAQTQRAILTHMAPLVRRDGALIYSTCTLTREENEEQITTFLAAHGNFVVDDARPLLPAPAQELCDTVGFVHMLPHRHSLDGFFAVRLKRVA